MNLGTIRDEILIRSGKSTTSGWVSDTNLKNWISQAHRWTAGFRKWPMTEGRIQTTFATGTGPNSDEWDFEGYRSDSIRLMQIGGKRLEKLNYEDYLIYREEKPDGDGRYFSDIDGIVVINPNIDLSGTVTAWGQYVPANFDITDETSETIFTEGNDDGNEAIIERAIGYAYKRDGKKKEALEQTLIAKGILEDLWENIKQEQALYKTNEERGGMFRRFNILNGRGVDDDFSINQF